MHHFSLQYTKYSREKMASSDGKSLAVGHIPGFWLDPSRFARQLRYFGVPWDAYIAALFLPQGCLRTHNDVLRYPPLPRRVQHILDKNPVPRSRIVHQHMGNGSNGSPARRTGADTTGFSCRRNLFYAKDIVNVIFSRICDMVTEENRLKIRKCTQQFVTELLGVKHRMHSTCRRPIPQNHPTPQRILLLPTHIPGISLYGM